MVFFGIGTQRSFRIKANNPQGQRIVEHFGFVQNLVCGSANGYSVRGFAECAFLHVQGSVSRVT
jgi:hypothetical protein